MKRGGEVIDLTIESSLKENESVGSKKQKTDYTNNVSSISSNSSGNQKPKEIMKRGGDVIDLTLDSSLEENKSIRSKKLRSDSKNNWSSKSLNSSGNHKPDRNFSNWNSRCQAREEGVKSGGKINKCRAKRTGRQKSKTWGNNQRSNKRNLARNTLFNYDFRRNMGMMTNIGGRNDQIFGNNGLNRSMSNSASGSQDNCSTPVKGFHSSNESLFPSSDVFSHPSDSFRQKLCPNPDHFDEVAKRLSCPLNSESALLGAGKWSQLSKDILVQFDIQQQKLNTMQQKILLWKELYRALKTEIDCGLCVFGSTFNGFGGDGCDLDMCVFPQGPAMGDNKWLARIRRILMANCRHFIGGTIQLIRAKVPILKFLDREGSLDVDISVNKPTGIRNTHLLHCYSQADYRVRPLVLAVKVWAKDHGINEARYHTLSSYTLTLMMIHYLQSGVSPPVLLCLHKQLPNIFNPRSDIFDLEYSVPNWMSLNRQSLGELLAGFFSYFTESSMFDPVRDVGSIRCGSVLEVADCRKFGRVNKSRLKQWSARLLIEDPFDRTNAARAVSNDQKWNLIQTKFRKTNQIIESGNIANMRLAELGNRGAVDE